MSIIIAEFLSSFKGNPDLNSKASRIIEWEIAYHYCIWFILGIISIIIGIVLIIFDMLLYGILCLIFGVIVIMVIGLGPHFEAKWTLRKYKHSPQSVVHTEREERIYNYLKDNENKAFNAIAIMNQLFSDSPSEVSKELVEQSLENLVKQGLIQQTQKDAEIFYLY